MARSKTISPEEVKTIGFSTTAGLESGFKGTDASSRVLSSTLIWFYDFFSLDQDEGLTWFPSWFSSKSCCSAAGASFTRECSGNKFWSTDFIPGCECLSVRYMYIMSRLAIKHLIANPTWQRTKPSLTYSHLIIKHSHLAIIWATESKPWLVAMWMQKFRWLYLWIFFMENYLNN